MSQVPDLTSVSCPVCLEIFSNPVCLPCNHMFCSSCLHKTTTPAGDSDSRCHICRHVYRTHDVNTAEEMENIISRDFGQCEYCQMTMKLTKLKPHLINCGADKPVSRFIPVGATSQPIPGDLTNRSTFVCPYCYQENLDVDALREHCLTEHADQHTKVVCPICASMPWGDSEQTSSDFISHVKLRHAFEYDTYVDYDQNDDSMLQAAIQASLET